MRKVVYTTRSSGSQRAQSGACRGQPRLAFGQKTKRTRGDEGRERPWQFWTTHGARQTSFGFQDSCQAAFSHARHHYMIDPTISKLSGKGRTEGAKMAAAKAPPGMINTSSITRRHLVSIPPRLMSLETLPRPTTMDTRFAQLVPYFTTQYPISRREVNAWLVRIGGNGWVRAFLEY